MVAVEMLLVAPGPEEFPFIIIVRRRRFPVTSVGFPQDAVTPTLVSVEASPLRNMLVWHRVPPGVMELPAPVALGNLMSPVLSAVPAVVVIVVHPHPAAHLLLPQHRHQNALAPVQFQPAAPELLLVRMLTASIVVSIPTALLKKHAFVVLSINV